MAAFTLLLCCVSITMATAFNNIPPRHPSNLENRVRPEPCCMPKTWQGDVGVSEAMVVVNTTYSDLIQILMVYAVKSEEKMIAQRIYDKYSHEDMGRQIMDFNTKTMYNITGNKCYKTALTDPFRRQCVPDDAVYYGSYYVGGMDGLKVDYWRFKNVTLAYDEGMGFTARSCIPIQADILVNTGQVSAFVSVEYANVVERILTPEIFDIPDICKNAIKRDGRPLAPGKYRPKTSFLRFY